MRGKAGGARGSLRRPLFTSAQRAQRRVTAIAASAGNGRSARPPPPAAPPRARPGTDHNNPGPRPRAAAPPIPASPGAPQCVTGNVVRPAAAGCNMGGAGGRGETTTPGSPRGAPCSPQAEGKRRGLRAQRLCLPSAGPAAGCPASPAAYPLR